MEKTRLIKKNHEVFPDDAIGLNEEGRIYIGCIDGYYAEPDYENEQTFLNRLEKCRVQRKNCFLEEWSYQEWKEVCRERNHGCEYVYYDLSGNNYDVLMRGFGGVLGQCEIDIYRAGIPIQRIYGFISDKE